MMIVKLEWTQSKAQQNIEQLQNPKMEVLQSTKNQQQQNHRPTKNGQHPKPPWAQMHFTGTKSLP